jgi:uncharacterized protein YaeQ
MALSATIHHYTVQLADIDRAVYQDLELRLARHPSETAEFMLTRLLAYCLEWQEGIAFTEGVAAVDEPAVLVRDLTGRITAWIEVGAPDAERLHRGSKLAGRAAIYTHRDPVNLLGQLAGKKIHKAEAIPLYTFGRGFVESAAKAIDRRNTVTLSVTERQLYLDVNGKNFSTAIQEQRLG